MSWPRLSAVSSCSWVANAAGLAVAVAILATLATAIHVALTLLALTLITLALVALRDPLLVLVVVHITIEVVVVADLLHVLVLDLRRTLVAALLLTAVALVALLLATEILVLLVGVLVLPLTLILVLVLVVGHSPSLVGLCIEEVATVVPPLQIRVVYTSDAIGNADASSRVGAQHETAGYPLVESLMNAEIRFSDLIILRKLSRRPIQHDLTDLEDVRPIRNTERHMSVLLDE